MTWEIGSVSRDANKNPVISFKFKQNGTDVVFNTFGSGKTELIDNFVGSPSVYFAFSVPQDGIAAPADYNASASGYIKKIWDGSATGTVSQPTSEAVSGALWIESNARFMPSARRPASRRRFSLLPSLYLPAPMLPPAPVKCTCRASGTHCPRKNLAIPGKSGLGTPVR